MKITKKLIIAATIAATLISVQSCTNGSDYVDNPSYWKALVTVRHNDDGWYMQLDENNILKATNLTKSPYGDREVRAIVYYSLEEEAIQTRAVETTMVKLHMIDSILTKSTVPYISLENAVSYGNDSIEVVYDWGTIAEDGYLNLRIRAPFSGNKKHKINLLRGYDPETPYSYELRHDAEGDWGQVSEALVAFKLDDIPYPLTKDVKFKLRWLSNEGEVCKEVTMKAPKK